MMRTRMLSASERWFRFLEGFYPPDFRDEMGSELVDAYMGRAHDALNKGGSVRLLSVWFRALIDSLRNGAAERVRPSASWRRTGNWGRDVELVSRVAKAESLLGRLNTANLLDSAYLVSAVCYHDGFLDSFPSDLPDADPSRRIVSRVERLLTPDRKQRYIELLHQRYVADVRALDAVRIAPVAAPVPMPAIASKKKRKRRYRGRVTHPYAIDLFAPEGSDVHAAGRGVVLLADAGWQRTEPFSTSSLRGGNTVIVFDPVSDAFYRYAHLNRVEVHPGELVRAGEILGTVGHTGLNASRAGHGSHLHFEINQYEGGAVRALEARELAQIVRSAAPATAVAERIPDPPALAPDLPADLPELLP